MPDAPPFGDVKPISAREWEDPKVVPANEIAKWMDEGWEPVGPCMMSATNNDTGAKVSILAWGIRRKYSPVRAILEKKPLARARVVLPLNGHGR